MNNLINKNNYSILACKNTAPPLTGEAAYIEVLATSGLLKVLVSGYNSVTQNYELFNTNNGNLQVSNFLSDNVGGLIEQKRNYSTILLASGIYTAANTMAITNSNFKGGHFIISVTTMTLGSLVPMIQGIDASGILYDILIGPTITAVGTYVLKIYPGITEIVSGAVSDILPYSSQLVITPSTSDSITYSATANMVM